MTTILYTHPPAPGFTEVELIQSVVIGGTRSPFSLVEQVQDHTGQEWGAEMRLPRMKREVAAPWQAFFLKLNIRRHVFLLGPDPAAATPLGMASSTPGTPVVDGAGQTGGTLNIRNAPTGVSGYLLEGDYIQTETGIASRLHMVLEDADTDGSGNAALKVWPNIRTSPADGALVTVSDAKGVFRLADPQISQKIRPPAIYHGVRITAIEVK